MTKLKITAGPFTFEARLEVEDAPKTCEAFLKRLPYESKVVHVRWSGEGVWVPLGDEDFGVGYENHTSHPAPVTSSFIRAVSARRKSCLPMVAWISPRKWASSRAIISSP